MKKKRVIAFSLFGDTPVYYKGAIANCILAPEIYPGWVCRIYTSKNISPSFIAELRSAGAEIIPQTQLNGYDGLFWRFYPAADKENDAVIIRDIDSRLNIREKSAVEEWLASNQPLHIIRDHPNHRRPIAAGLWGCRANAIPDMVELIADFGARFGFEERKCDEIFLGRYIYPHFRNNHYLHSSFAYFPGETPRKIPIPRSGLEYLGYPPGRGEISKRRLAAFEKQKASGLTEYPLPDWVPSNHQFGD